MVPVLLVNAWPPSCHFVVSDSGLGGVVLCAGSHVLGCLVSLGGSSGVPPLFCGHRAASLLAVYFVGLFFRFFSLLFNHVCVCVGQLLFVLHYRISKLCRVLVTLGKGQVTLGKVFAECNTRQTTLGKESHGNADFAECRITGTRQRICRVPWHSANKPRGATPGPALCRVSNGRHSVKCPRQGAATWLFYRVLALGKKGVSVFDKHETGQFQKHVCCASV